MVCNPWTSTYERSKYHHEGFTDLTHLGGEYEWQTTPCVIWTTLISLGNLQYEAQIYTDFVDWMRKMANKSRETRETSLRKPIRGFTYSSLSKPQKISAWWNRIVLYLLTESVYPFNEAPNLDMWHVQLLAVATEWNMDFLTADLPFIAQ